MDLSAPVKNVFYDGSYSIVKIDKEYRKYSCYGALIQTVRYDDCLPKPYFVLYHDNGRPKEVKYGTIHCTGRDWRKGPSILEWNQEGILRRCSYFLNNRCHSPPELCTHREWDDNGKLIGSYWYQHGICTHWGSHLPLLQGPIHSPPEKYSIVPHRYPPWKYVPTGPYPGNKIGYYGKILNYYHFYKNIPSDDNPFWNEVSLFFVGIPKTGCTSISKAMGHSFSFAHMYGRHYPPHVRKKLFTIVRNPYDRLVSAYHFMIRGGFRNNISYLMIRDKYASFEDWVINGLSEDLCTYDRSRADMETTAKQSDWVTDDDGKLLIQKENIGHFETLKADALRLFNIKELPHLNSSKRDDWKKYYTNPKVRIKVYRLYRKDFELFGYEK